MSADTNRGSSMPPLRPMSLSEILDHSFKVYGRAWKPLVTVGALSAIPTILLTGASNSLTAADPMDRTNNWFFRVLQQAEVGNFSGLIAMLSMFGVGLLLILLLYPLVQGAVVTICARTYLGQPVTAGEALRVAWHRYFALLGTMFLKGIMMIVGTPIFVLAGLVILFFITLPAGWAALSTYLAFTVHVIMVEGTGGGPAAISRSFKLVSGRFWPLLGTGIVFTLLTSVINGFASFIGMIFGLITLAVGPLAVLNWLSAFISGAFSAVTMPFLMVGLTLAYYDTRIRKEGFDLEMLARSQISQDAPL
jgi:hypothetical protein